MKLSYSNSIQKLSFLSALLFVFWLPLFEGFMPTIFGVWIGFWLLEGKFKTRFREFNFKSGLFLSLLAYFVLSLIAVLYTSNQAKAWFDVQQKIALVVFPLLLAGMSPYFWKNIRWVFWAFIAGLLVASTYDLVFAFKASYAAGADQGIFHYWVYDTHQNIGFIQLIMMRYSLFSYGYLSQWMHPSYFSMYLILGIVFIFHFYKEDRQRRPLIKAAYLLVIVFFLTMLFFLQSSAGLISLAVIFIGLFLTEFKFLRKKKVITYASFIVVLTLVILGAYYVNNKSAYNSDLLSSESFSKSSNVRLSIWENSVPLGLENPILGIGPGDLRDSLKEALETSGNSGFANGNFNMHNQFLESFIGIGLIGLTLLFAILFYAFRIARMQKNALLNYLLIILVLNFFFESVLNRQSGLFFFLFFLSLFAFNPNTPPIKSK